MSLSTSRNTTARAEAVHILRTEEFFHKIYQQAATGIAITDWQGVFQECNPAYCALLGYTEKELRTIDFASLIHPEEREANLVQVRRLKAGEIPSFDIENRYIHKNGELVWVHKFVSVLHGEEGEPTHLIALVTNITERKLAEDVRLRHTAIVESSDDAIMGLDANGTVVNWNKGAERLYGYSAKEAIGRKIFFLSTANDPDDIPKILKKVLKGEVLRNYETVRLRKNGTHVEVSLTLSPIVDAEGRIVGVSGIARDITERKRTQERLRASEERLRLAQKVARIGTFEWNIETGVNIWTPELETMYGLAPGSFGKTEAAFENLVHPNDRGQVLEWVNEALKTGRPNRGEWRVIWPDRSVHWIAGRWQVLMDESGEPSRMLGVNIDITERKNAELALSETNLALEKQTAVLQSREELLKIFVKNVPAGVAMFDREMRYLQASDRWCADYGIDSSQVAGSSHYELFPDLPARWKEIHRRALQGETLRAEEDRWDRAGGGTMWIYWVARPWMALDGTPGGILILAEDITHRKQMEEELSGMTRKLVEAQEQERARIARELHDDVNQRVALLSIGLDELRLKHDDLPPEVRARAHELQRLASEISTDLHALSHELHSSKLDCLGVVRAMTSWCKEFGDGQKLKIDFTSQHVPKLSQEISICLFRVLQEAVHNAAKHSGAKRIEVQLVENSGDILLIVSDSGKGFDVKAAQRRQGLGLTSMQERVRLAGGTIAIESTPRGGTTIHVRVPLESEDRSQRAAV